MNAALISRWPELPALPPPGVPILIRVQTTPPRRPARQKLRTVLRQVLAAWSGLPPEQLPLGETSRGPVWQGQLGGHDLDISLSYAEGEGWIGLRRAGRIGVDVMQIQNITEAEAVARIYFSPEAWKIIQQSANPALAFATAWTTLEALLKCLKRGLTESSGASAWEQPDGTVQSLTLPGSRILTVATAPSRREIASPASP